MSILPLLGVICFVISIALIIWWQRRKKRYSPLVEPALRPAGYSLSRKLDDIWDRIFFLYFFLSALPFLYIYLVDTGRMSDSLLSIALFLVMGSITLYSLIIMFLKARHYQLGRDGEVYTGQELNLLMREGAWVFHDIRYRYGNIDHVVVSTGGVFVMETKTARKPSDKRGRKEYRVVVRGGEFVRPKLGAKPIEQVELNADYLRKILFEELGFKPLVVACIALPGWFVEPSPLYVKRKVIAFNPKRTASIRKLVRRNKMPEVKVAEIAAFFDRKFRTLISKADITDPNAGEKYSLLFDRRVDKFDI